MPMFPVMQISREGVVIPSPSPVSIQMFPQPIPMVVPPISRSPSPQPAKVFIPPCSSGSHASSSTSGSLSASSSLEREFKILIHGNSLSTNLPRL